jgi:hypothetical protein
MVRGMAAAVIRSTKSREKSSPLSVITILKGKVMRAFPWGTKKSCRIKKIRENLKTANIVFKDRPRMPPRIAKFTLITITPKTKKWFAVKKQAAHREKERNSLVKGFSRCSGEFPGI